MLASQKTKKPSESHADDEQDNHNDNLPQLSLRQFPGESSRSRSHFDDNDFSQENFPMPRQQYDEDTHEYSDQLYASEDASVVLPGHWHESSCFYMDVHSPAWSLA